MAPSSADRTANAFKAALSLAAKDDKRIVNGAAWHDLERLPDSGESRNTILDDIVVRSVVAAAYAIDPAYGLLTETAAVTGVRRSQLLRVEVRDLQDGVAAPRLMVPNSRKGRRRKVERKPLPIPPTLARALKQASADRQEDAPLLLRADGSRWPKTDWLFCDVVAAVGLDPGVTAYALRHSSIVRQLLAGTPIRVVASLHDTSTAMIEKTYSRFIVGDPSDAMVRRALLDVASPAPAVNVVPIGRNT